MASIDIIQFLQVGSYVATAVAGLLLVLAVVLFFTMKIPEVINDLSGKARSSQTAKMISSYEQTGSLRSGASPVSGSTANSDSKANSGKTKATVKTEQIGRTGQISHARKVSKTPKPKSGPTGFRFEITKDIVVVHTSERI